MCVPGAMYNIYYSFTYSCQERDINCILCDSIHRMSWKEHILGKTSVFPWNPLRARGWAVHSKVAIGGIGDDLVCCVLIMLYLVISIDDWRCL